MLLLHKTYSVGFNRWILRRFRQALRMHPGAPPALRVALGVSAFRLGKLEVARKAFRRATELDPCCVAALTALAVLELHGVPSAAVRTATSEYLQPLQRRLTSLATALRVDTTVTFANSPNSSNVFGGFRLADRRASIFGKRSRQAT